MHGNSLHTIDGVRESRVEVRDMEIHDAPRPMRPGEARSENGCVDVGVVYGADVVRVMEVLQQAAKRADLVLDDPAPEIAFWGLGASSLDFKVHAWCKSADYLDMLHNVRHTVYDDLNKAGIEIPFNQIVVHQGQ